MSFYNEGIQGSHTDTDSTNSNAYYARGQNIFPYSLPTTHLSPEYRQPDRRHFACKHLCTSVMGMQQAKGSRVTASSRQHTSPCGCEQPGRNCRVALDHSPSAPEAGKVLQAGGKAQESKQGSRGPESGCSTSSCACNDGIVYAGASVPELVAAASSSVPVKTHLEKQQAKAQVHGPCCSSGRLKWTSTSLSSSRSSRGHCGYIEGNRQSRSFSLNLNFYCSAFRICNF